MMRRVLMCLALSAAAFSTGGEARAEGDVCENWPDDPRFTPEQSENWCDALRDVILAERRAEFFERPWILAGTSPVGCDGLGDAPFTGMRVQSLVPEAVPAETRVLFVTEAERDKPAESLQLRPSRLTIYALHSGLITGWSCG